MFRLYFRNHLLDERYESIELIQSEAVLHTERDQEREDFGGHYLLGDAKLLVAQR